MSEFDSKASTWDENPMHLDRSSKVAIKMQEILPLQKRMRALEYGAGTGILSFLLHEQLDEITMMDNSVEMVRVMNQKVSDRKVSNLLPICFNLETSTSDVKYDLVFNQMVLHHISNVEAIFEKFFDMILPGGFLAIADLYTEDGSFHSDGFEGHLGFDPEKLKEKLLGTGFLQVKFEQCYSVERKNPDGSIKSYPIFLLIASK
jgi:tRNA (cmo5U34)-methyltransferase